MTIDQRLKELSFKKDFWAILALDHGLTEYKDAVSVSKVDNLISSCADSFGSVVMTYGLAKRALPSKGLPVIIQCFGAPHGQPKIQICDIQSVLRLGAEGVAVQVDFKLKGSTLLSQLGDISKLVNEAHRYNLPVLFMISHEETTSLQDILKPLRFCLELGADLIKIRCFLSQFSNEHDVAELKETLSFYPPILLAGGNPQENICNEFKESKDIGFSGYCVGRTIFQSSNPAETSNSILNKWFNN